ncbi:zf-HC2 domain-containing protein [Colwellia sp. KU-HH00111]|uniref:anti-sigma factor family protein n=1 Tax=Colwellia sp. KU-HH00111 TaxID=3127652 RepID=UPI003365ACF4
MIKRLMTKYVPGMLTCEEVDSFLYDFHEGQLSNIEKVKFKLHLSMCAECRAYVRGYKNTIRISQAGFKKAEPIENIPEELLEVILKSRTKN